MSELLSNTEIETLLLAFRAEGETLHDAVAALERQRQPNQTGPRAHVTEVDLLKPNRFARDQVRRVERLLNGAAKGIAASLSDRLRLEVGCDCVAVEQMRFSTWMSLLVDPVAIYMLDLPPLETPVLLTATTDLLHRAVDRVMGGVGRGVAERCELTDAEFAVVDALIGPCLDKLCRALEELGQFAWSIEGRTCNPTTAEIFPGQDVVLAAHLQVSSQPMLGDFRLVVPHSGLAALLETVDPWPGPSQAAKPGAMRAATTRSVRGVPVSLTVELGRLQLQLGRLLSMQPGDVLPLGGRGIESTVAKVQGMPKFRGKVGVRGRQLAFQVVEVVE